MWLTKGRNLLKDSEIQGKPTIKVSGRHYQGSRKKLGKPTQLHVHNILFLSWVWRSGCGWATLEIFVRVRGGYTAYQPLRTQTVVMGIPSLEKTAHPCWSDMVQADVRVQEIHAVQSNSMLKS